MSKIRRTIIIDTDTDKAVEEMMRQFDVSRSKIANDLMDMLIQLHQGNVKTLEGITVLLSKYISPRKK